MMEIMVDCDTATLVDILRWCGVNDIALYNFDTRIDIYASLSFLNGFSPKKNRSLIWRVGEDDFTLLRLTYPNNINPSSSQALPAVF